MGLYFICRENKGVDQLCSNYTADLRLCFCICRKACFLMKWFISSRDVEGKKNQEVPSLKVRFNKVDQKVMVREQYITTTF